jgi:hypothetical protein
MIKKFVVEIRTEIEPCVTTTSDIHLALTRYFASGVYIRVRDADECPFCFGKGKFTGEYDDIRCHWCDGTGILHK